MKHVFLGLFAVILLNVSGIAHAEDVATTDTLVIEQPYSGSTWGNQKNGAAFFSVTNTSDTDVKLVSASTDIAEEAQLHTHEMNGDVMSMRQVKSFEIKAGETLKLAPHGDHIMLMSLKQQLDVGQKFDLTLSFDNGLKQTVSVDVLKAGTKPESHAEHMNHEDHSDHSNHGEMKEIGGEKTDQGDHDDHSHH